MIPIAKAKLEEICLQYLNHQPRVRPISRIVIDRPNAENANWSIGRVEPQLDLHDVKTSVSAIRDLQRVFRVVV
jgi:hypothetical protein